MCMYGVIADFTGRIGTLHTYCLFKFLSLGIVYLTTDSRVICRASSGSLFTLFMTLLTRAASVFLTTKSVFYGIKMIEATSILSYTKTNSCILFTFFGSMYVYSSYIYSSFILSFHIAGKIQAKILSNVLIAMQHSVLNFTML